MISPEFRAISLLPDSDLSHPVTSLIYGELAGTRDVTFSDIDSLRSRGTDYYALVEKGEPLAAGVVKAYDDQVAVLEYIAVDSCYRVRPDGVRFGYGRQILECIEFALAQRSTERLEVNPLAQSIGFFAKCGYESHNNDPRGSMSKNIAGISTPPPGVSI